MKWAIALLIAASMVFPVALLCIWLLKPTHRVDHEMYCCSRPVDVLGNAQELHAASDSLAGCLAKRGAPIMIPTETPDGDVIVFYIACSVGR